MPGLLLIIEGDFFLFPGRFHFQRHFKQLKNDMFFFAFGGPHRSSRPYEFS
jgi:hypothetical protein